MIEIEVIAMEVSWKMAGFMAGGYESWPIPLIKKIFPIRVPFRKFHILVDSEYAKMNACPDHLSIHQSVGTGL